jgi:anti-anti-sigma regulatory factor
MATITTRAVRHIGIIDVDGSLDDASVARLHEAFAEAVVKAGSRYVLIVADKITSMEEKAALVMVAECGKLRAEGGNAAWVSRSGWLPTRGTAASTTLFMGVYRTVEQALDLFHIHTDGTP